MSKDTFELTRETLPTGLRTLLLPRSDRQAVTFLVLIGVGSRYETLKQWGLSHFLEHMFFKGTTTRPSAKQIAEAIEGVGGEFNAFTGEEFTGYYVKVAAHHLARGAEVVSDILLRPLFAPEEIERERGVITEEIRMYTSTPMHHVQHLWHEALFGSHPLGRRIDGSEATVAAFAQTDFQRYVSTHYHTANTVVAVAGKFNPREVRLMLARLFEPLAAGKPSSAVATPKRLPAQRIKAEYRSSLEQTQLIIGVPGVSLTDDDHWSAELLSIILGSGMSSRLFLSVRERHGLAYAIRTSSTNFIDSGSFATYAGVRTEQTDLALRLILEEYNRVMEYPVEESELTKAKQMFYGHLMLELEDTNSLATFAAGQEVLTRKVLLPAAIKKKIDAVSVADIQQVARRLLGSRQRALAILSPRRSVRTLERMLD